MPKGNLLKQNLPKGVINVVNRQESSGNGICQNPLFASSLVNTVAPASLPKVSSTEGMGCNSLKTLLFNGFKSTQILTSPDFFGTTTIPAHQGVGVSIQFAIRPWTPFAPAPVVLCHEVVEAHSEECTMNTEQHCL